MSSAKPSEPSTRWHIAKDQTGQCQIVKSAELDALPEVDKQVVWGAFDSQGDAIAKRVGLIRSGKCHPA
ncbi:MAG: DDE transposase family protein [Cyanobacteria bacterium J06632_22]